jgi:2-dehydro-3-deoxygluconokinase
MKRFAKKYGAKIIATTMRKVISPTKHLWKYKIYCVEEDKYYEELPCEEIEVVDRIGSGDAYLAGVLFRVIKYQSIQEALEFYNYYVDNFFIL